MTLLDITLNVVAAFTLLWLGWSLGRRSGLRGQARKCSCGHGYGSHINGKRCNAEVRRVNYWSSGTRNGKRWVKCPCLRHDGPLPSVVLEEIVRDWTTPKDPHG